MFLKHPVHSGKPADFFLLFHIVNCIERSYWVHMIQQYLNLFLLRPHYKGVNHTYLNYIINFSDAFPNILLKNSMNIFAIREWQTHS